MAGVPATVLPTSLEAHGCHCSWTARRNNNINRRTRIHTTNIFTSSLHLGGLAGLVSMTR